MIRRLTLLLSLAGCLPAEFPATAPDADGDGYSFGDGDCDDQDAAVSPASVWYLDGDGDGVGTDTDNVTQCDAPAGYVLVAGDCDDADEATYPGADELCDGDDQDCDGVADNGATGGQTWYSDVDEDGHGDPDDGVVSCAPVSGRVASSDDCDDALKSVFPGADELCNDVDDDCDGETDVDATDAPTWFIDTDKDGFGSDVSLVACNDPGEGYSEFDGDCDDTSDAVGDFRLWYLDLDADGFGDASTEAKACDAPSKTHISDHADCNDTRDDVSPADIEVCGGVDEDCDGTVDEADASDAKTWYVDGDVDGWGTGSGTKACLSPVPGLVERDGDCRDNDEKYHPEAVESCTDPADYNCDGSSGYADADADGSPACEDCNDAVHAIHPGAQEVCDSANLDEDCDGTADNADSSATGTSTWYADVDKDGFGGGVGVVACDGAAGDADQGGDCVDTDNLISPAAIEVCDASDVDEDCNGAADDDDSEASGKTAWYTDGDGDKFGAGAAAMACDPGDGQVAVAGDCNDVAAAVNPDATEVCDPSNVDEDCDGSADDLDVDATGKLTVYADTDGDGFGVGDALALCDLDGEADVDGDCDDLDGDVYPGAIEVVGDGVDQDCDTEETCYVDADGDGARTDATVASKDLDCEDAGEAGDVAVDCDDGDVDVFPGAPELCDDMQNDCDAVGWSTTNEEATVTWYAPASTDGVAVTGWTGGAIDILDPGTYDVCPGSYNVQLMHLGGAASIVGHGEGRPIIVAVGENTGLTVSGATAEIDITHLEFQLAGLKCLDHGLLWLDDVHVQLTGDHGLYASDCDLVDVANSQFYDNIGPTHGAGVYLSGTVASFTNTALYRNFADQYGGAIYAFDSDLMVIGGSIYGNSADHGGAVSSWAIGRSTILTLDGTRVANNYAAVDASAFELGGAPGTASALECVASAVVDNVSPAGAAVQVTDALDVTSDTCDWGSTASEDDNLPHDLIDDTKGFYDYAGLADFLCDETDGCISL